MLADELNTLWLARRGSIGVDALMRFTEKGLMLGAGTILARSGDSSRDITIDPTDRRFFALLTAAHLARPSISGLAHLRRAADCWREGRDALAAMHLVLSRLDRLERPEADSHRLFIADGLLKRGANADSVIDAIESGPSGVEQLRKFDPDQPRVAAGSGRTSGQWTAGGGGGSPAASALTGARSPRIAAPNAGRTPPQDRTQRQAPRQLHPSATPGARTDAAGASSVRPGSAPRPAPPPPVSSSSAPGAPPAAPMAPRAPSGGGRHALALTLPVPATIEASFPFHPSACRTARNFCAIHAAESAPPHGPAANDNLPFEEELRIEREVIRRVKTCADAEVMCDLVDVVVWGAPIPITGFARFPDGGVVVLRKGDEEGMYFPRGAPIRYRR